MTQIDTHELYSEEFSMFEKMYREYMAHLSQFSERIGSIPVTEVEIELAWLNPDLERYFITVDDHCVGFILLGINNNKHPESDWFIAEMHITKDAQGMGIGKKTIEELIKTKHGAFCLYILDKNIAAQRFWEHAFANINYENTTHRYTCACAPSDCSFYMYEPKKESSKD